MKILLLSAYDAASHQYWREGIVEHIPEHEWTVLTLPARFFSWRVRGNSLTWAFEQKAILSQHYDLIVATSMADISGLKGLVPSLAHIPTIVYFHENQFAYPKTEQAFNSVEPQMLSIYSGVAANGLVFNTDFNRQTFLAGARQLLKKLPDQVPKGIVESLEAKSHVIAVPIRGCDKQCRESSNRTQLSVVWNHRWEYDKGPILLKHIVEKALLKSLDIKFHIVGQRFRYTPVEFDEIAELLKQTTSKAVLGHFGFVESRDAYYQLLRTSDVVLSTAEHDFQGLSILEAVYRGCTPLVPNKLAYPEILGQQFCYGQDSMELDKLAVLAVEKLAVYASRKQAGNSLPKANVERFTWPNLIGDYQSIFNEVVNG
ncbi:DUF3524 domain-containing protein [Thalassotalea euphylliae]|uniref:tRNA-queuosine alpha-mannosyltransferase domain-containing protein n=1 Tax=Thalassotalea euphylliae TaxID=1655234 RepID=UPI003641520B